MWLNRMTISKMLGSLCIAFGILFWTFLWSNRNAVAHGGADFFHPVVEMGAALVALGVGLLRRNTFSGVVFIVISVGTAAWLAVGTLTLPFPFSIMNILFACVVGAPGALLWRRWNDVFPRRS